MAEIARVAAGVTLMGEYSEDVFCGLCDRLSGLLVQVLRATPLGDRLGLFQPTPGWMVQMHAAESTVLRPSG